MKLFAMDSYCSPEIVRELARTPSMRARVSKVGFIQSPVDQYQRFERIRPTRSREVLAKAGSKYQDPRRAFRTRFRLATRAAPDVRSGSVVNRCLSACGQNPRRNSWQSGGSLVAGWLGHVTASKFRCRRKTHGRRPSVRSRRRPSLPDLPPGEAVEIVIRLPN